MKIHELYLLPNLLSLSRFILAILTLFFLWDKLYLESIIIITTIWVTDILDGYIARSKNQITETGKIIDPLADKFTIISISFVLLLQGILPLWFVIAVLARDIFIFIGGLYLKTYKNVVLQSNSAGKIAVFIIGLTIINFIFKEFLVKTYSYNISIINIWELIINVLIFISLMMILISFSIYLYRFISIVNRK